ncbi:helix-turn-helix domain-containing protein [Photobacterium kishitanii]|uniref:helix-turn-helix domain-containing protein n=1 Tax=Photobacterium kishitanii TaxID=318456 RepID=UPI0005D3E7EB|nr:AraC family transcriptional regulator [Photobacterium kishitanii]KJG10220.1 AraC family transcriptional regulator [Photobacterium kishitanii]OBU28164.1 AraC family transcriptional regulator [Photobacterium kishitanii]PSV06972.1 AraC family transcriptional regulator [Photobacterium kishitanii]PSV14469.1 AraC family transcriptional regulator [Photobacterium kishitanii]PSV78008.1 AraC family transcriptional regulator [Photobacterium kishitanii]
MKASLEKVPQRVGVSWRLKQIVDREKDFSWHYHNKEFELMLHRNFHSRCHIGHYHGELEPLSMILIAPNTPHAIQAIETNNNEDFETIVIWFKQDWIANMMFSCHELRKIDVLLKRAQKGLLFNQQAANDVAIIVDDIVTANYDSIELLSQLLKIFAILCKDKTSKTLQSHHIDNEIITRNHKEKIERICNFIEKHYAEPLTLADIANNLCTSESTVHRLFEQHFNESFIQYLKKLRLNHAAEALMSSSDPISHIAEHVGYRNQANFNRQFRQYKGMTPREYRRTYKLNAKV